MLNKSRVLFKSLVVTSPILVISALAILLSVNSILNYEEESPGTGLDMPDVTNGTEAIPVEAVSLWTLYNDAQTNDELIITYTSKNLIVKGIFIDWEITSDDYIAIKLATSQSDALVHCMLLETYQDDDPAYDLMRIDSYRGREVLMTGFNEGWVDGTVVISKCVDIVLSGEGSADIFRYTVDALILWEAYKEDQASQASTNNTVLATKNRAVNVEGVLDSWEINEEKILILRLATLQGEALVKCIFVPEDLEEDTFVYDLPQIEEGVGHKVTIQGICDGWSGNEVIISECKGITFSQKTGSQ